MVFTNSGEQHVIQQKSNGHYDQDKFPGFPSRVKICPDIGAGHIVSSLGTHPDIHTSQTPVRHQKVRSDGSKIDILHMSSVLKFYSQLCRTLSSN